MFPEEFAERHILAYSSPNDLIFDPFSGRGTTVFQSLVMNRKAFGTDINPVAACISGAKADAPALLCVLDRLNELEGMFGGHYRDAPNEFFHYCFDGETLQQVLFLRESLHWKQDRTDRFIAAMSLGALHGESHKSKLCFSNRMPRTISTKPEYSIRWWQKHDLTPPKRNVFEILRTLTKFRLGSGRPDLTGEVVLTDARCASTAFPQHRGRVKLIVTSPPYLDVTDYAEDQWLRLWFLGGDPSPRTRVYKDDRHTSAVLYWRFLREVWTGVAELLSNEATIVVRIGGSSDRDEIEEALSETVATGFEAFDVSVKSPPQTSALRNRQTNAFRPGTANGVEHDFVFSLAQRGEGLRSAA